ncbi:MAG: retropepsin-like aspartic protease, partial [Candidatus Sericytochromatia bacterium]
MSNVRIKLAALCAVNKDEEQTLEELWTQLLGEEEDLQQYLEFLVENKIPVSKDLDSGTIRKILFANDEKTESVTKYSISLRISERIKKTKDVEELKKDHHKLVNRLDSLADSFNKKYKMDISAPLVEAMVEFETFVRGYVVTSDEYIPLLHRLLPRVWSEIVERLIQKKLNSNEERVQDWTKVRTSIIEAITRKHIKDHQFELRKTFISQEEQQVVEDKFFVKAQILGFDDKEALREFLSIIEKVNPREAENLTRIYSSLVRLNEAEPEATEVFEDYHRGQISGKHYYRRSEPQYRTPKPVDHPTGNKNKRRYEHVSSTATSPYVSKIKCWKCNEDNHTQNKCNKQEDGVKVKRNLYKPKDQMYKKPRTEYDQRVNHFQTLEEFRRNEQEQESERETHHVVAAVRKMETEEGFDPINEEGFEKEQKEQEQEEKIENKLLWVDTILNSIRAKALYDTGATSSTVSKEFVMKLNDQSSYPVVINRAGTRVQFANGQVQSCSTIRLFVECNGESEPHTFIILEKSCSEVIFGLDIINKFEIPLPLRFGGVGFSSTEISKLLRKYQQAPIEETILDDTQMFGIRKHQLAGALKKSIDEAISNNLKTKGKHSTIGEIKIEFHDEKDRIRGVWKAQMKM